ncbi:response regulator [Novosphingobium sp. G106]|uniref:response regulator n=1 Tax=Novosphingobium sp. G106 TaxID=2849500 RepID=UPI001C2CF7B9|nr:response regulator [Novosphingobium sp. G106]MBV1690303.1 response regulator [Novosphingobium sp. G106]
MTLRDRLVLIVEDEPIVALALEDLIEEAGGWPLSAERIDEAFAMIAEHTVELAILDINVHGHRSYPVARMLLALGVPFIFATGYGDALHPPEFEAIPTIVKPYSLADIERAIEKL